MNRSSQKTKDDAWGEVKHSGDLWILAFLLALPSTGFIQKHAGLAGVAIYVAVVIGLVLLSAHLTRRCSSWIERHFRRLAILSITGLAVGYVALHPLEDGRGPGKSSDRDDGLDMAVTRLVHGETPYYPSNRIAGPLSVLPGSIVLAAPFVALGDSGYQNVFWLAVFLFAALAFFGDKPTAIWLWVVPLVLSVAAQYEFVSGGDLISNGIFVALFFFFALHSWRDKTPPGWRRWLACVLVGVGLASRANYLLLLPLFGAAMWRAAGFRSALAFTTLAGLVTCAISVPFYLNDPAGFAPLGSSNKLKYWDHLLPWASTAMIGMTVLSAGIAAQWLIKQRSLEPVTAFFRCCALVTLTPMACAILVSTWSAGHPDFLIMKDRFGLMYVFFALLGWGACLKTNAPKPDC